MKRFASEGTKQLSKDSRIGLKDIRTPGQLRTQRPSPNGEMQPAKQKNEFLYSAGAYNPVHALENSLKIGSVQDIFKIYKNLNQAGIGSLKELPVEEYKKLLKRIASGHFGYLGGENMAKFALQIRDDLIKSGRECDIEIEEYVIRSIGYISISRAPGLIKHFTKIIDLNKNREISELLPLYSALVEIMCKLECFEFCEELVLKLQGKKLNLNYLYLQLVRGYINAGKIEQAELIYQKSRKEGYEDLPEFKLALMNGHAAKGNLPETRKLFDQIPSTLPIYDNLKHTAMINCHAVRQVPDEALTQYKQMREQGVQVKPLVYEHMIKANMSNSTAATRWFYKPEGISHINPSMGMFGGLIKSFIISGNSLAGWRTLKEALSSFKKSRSKSGRFHLPLSNTLPIVNDLKEKSTTYLRGMVIHAPIGRKARPELFTKLMFAAIENNDPDLVLRFYQEYTVKTGCAVGKIPYKSHLYAIKALVMQNKLDEAREIFDNVIDESFGLEVDTYDVVFKGYAAAGEKQKFEELYQDFKKHNLKDTILTFEARLAFGQGADEVVKAGLVANKEFPLVLDVLQKQGLVGAEYFPLTK
jgi:tetratricopeptide (TPR) repeat protein